MLTRTEARKRMPDVENPQCRDLSWVLGFQVGTPEHEYAQGCFNGGYWDGVADRKAGRTAPSFWNLGEHYCPLYEAGWVKGNQIAEPGTSSFPHWADLLVGLRRAKELNEIP